MLISSLTLGSNQRIEYLPINHLAASMLNNIHESICAALSGGSTVHILVAMWLSSFSVEILVKTLHVHENDSGAHSMMHAKFRHHRFIVIRQASS